MCYVARYLFKFLRLHNTCVMLPCVPFHNIKTPGFTLSDLPGTITHHLLSTTVVSSCTVQLVYSTVTLISSTFKVQESKVPLISAHEDGVPQCNVIPKDGSFTSPKEITFGHNF